MQAPAAYLPPNALQALAATNAALRKALHSFDTLYERLDAVAGVLSRNLGLSQAG